MSDSLLFEYEISGVKYESSGVKLEVAITAAQNCQVSSNIAANLTIFADATATQLPKGGTLIFTAYVGSDPASTVHPKKYQEFQAPICTLTLKKDPKMHRNDPQTSPILL